MKRHHTAAFHLAGLMFQKLLGYKLQSIKMIRFAVIVDWERKVIEVVDVEG